MCTSTKRLQCVEFCKINTGIFLGFLDFSNKFKKFHNPTNFSNKTNLKFSCLNDYIGELLEQSDFSLIQMKKWDNSFKIICEKNFL